MTQAQFDAIHFSYRGADTVIKDGSGHQIVLVTDAHVGAADLVFGIA